MLIDFAPPRKTEPLSRIPSVLIGQVCDDLETVMGLKGVRLNMPYWAVANGECEVCAAGAVILCRAPREQLRRDDWCAGTISNDISEMMDAVDFLRRGAIEPFLDALGVVACESICRHLLKQVDAMKRAVLWGEPTPEQVRNWIAAARTLAVGLKELGH